MIKISIYVGGNTFRKFYDFFTKEVGVNHPLTLYHQNVDINNLPSPPMDENDNGWSLIDNQTLLNKVKSVNNEGNPVETNSAEFYQQLYHLNQPSDGSMSCMMGGSTINNVAEKRTKLEGLDEQELPLSSYSGNTQYTLKYDVVKNTNSGTTGTIKVKDKGIKASVLAISQKERMKNYMSMCEGKMNVKSIKGRTSKNLVKNGNFANGTTGWSSIGSGNLSVTDNVLSSTGLGLHSTLYALQNTDLPVNLAHNYFSRFIVKVDDSSAINLLLQIQGTTGGGVTTLKTVSNPIGDQWYVCYGVGKLPVTATDNFRTYVYASYQDSASQLNKVLQVKEAFSLDITAEGLESKTADEINAMFPTYFEDIQSTVLHNVKILSKNLIPQLTLGSLGSNGVEFSDDNTLRTPFIEVKANTEYSVKRFDGGIGVGYRFYDSNLNFISELNWGAVSEYLITTPSNTKYIRNVFYNSNDINIQVQLEKGNSSIEHTSYKESVETIEKELHGFNNVFDEIVNNTVILRNKEYVLTVDDIESIYSGYADVDIITCKTFQDNIQWYNYTTGDVIVEGFNEVTQAIGITTAGIGTCHTSSSQKLYFTVAKGSMDLSNAKSSFSGIKILYNIKEENYVTETIDNYSNLIDTYDGGNVLTETDGVPIYSLDADIPITNEVDTAITNTVGTNKVLIDSADNQGLGKGAIFFELGDSEIVVDNIMLFPGDETDNDNLPENYIDGFKSVGEINYVDGKYVGKNLANPEYIEIRNDAVNQYDGVIRLVNINNLKSLGLKNGDTVTISFDNNTIVNSSIYLNEWIFETKPAINTNTVGRKSITTTVVDDSKDDIKLFKTHTDGDIYSISNFQIEKSSIATDHEDYYEGVKIEVLSKGRNLIDYTKFVPRANSGETVEIINNGVRFTGSYYFQLDNTGFVRVGTPYVAQWDCVLITEGATMNPSWRFKYTDETYSPIVGSGISITPTKEVALVMIYHLLGDGVFTSEFTNIQLEIGNASTSYESYKEDKKDILIREPLRNLPNGTKDYMNSVGKVKRGIGNVVLDDNLAWGEVSSGSGTNNIMFQVKLKDGALNTSSSLINTISSVIPSKTFSAIWNNDTEGIAITTINATECYLRVKIARFKLITDDVTGFKTWLQTNPITTQYPLLNENYQSSLSFCNSLPNGVMDTVVQGDGVWKLHDDSVSINGEFYKVSNVKEYVIIDDDMALQIQLTNVSLIKVPKEKLIGITDLTNDTPTNIYIETKGITENIPSEHDNINSIGKYFTSDVGLYFVINKETTLEQAKSQLVATKIYYELETPTYTQLTAEELAEYNLKKDYLNKTLILESYEGGSIEVNSEVPPHTEIVYTTDIADVDTLTMTCQEENKVKAFLIECNMTDVANDLYGGSNSALESALKGALFSISMGKGISEIWVSDKNQWSKHELQWGSDVYYQNHTENIASGTFKPNLFENFGYQYITDSNKIYILLTSSDIATSTVPSVLSLDYAKIEVDIDRKHDVVEKPILNIENDFTIIMKGISRIKDLVSGTNVYLLNVDKNGDRFAIKFQDDTLRLLNIIGGSNIDSSANSSPLNCKAFESISILMMKKGNTLALYYNTNQGENNFSNPIEIVASNVIIGEYTLELLGYGVTYIADSFLDSFYFFDNKTFSDNEAETILKGDPPVGLESDVNLISLIDKYKNPNLMPKFDNPLWNIHPNATVSSDGETLTLNAPSAWNHSEITFPVLPNNKYQLICKSAITGARLDISEYRDDFEVKDYISVEANSGRIFTTNSYTNKVHILVTSNTSGTFIFSDLELRRIDY